MGYDFLKSVSPDKIIFNSESHLLSGSHVRDLYMDPAFVRAVFWGAHTLGLNASQIWYWPRKEDGSIRLPVSNGYAGSNNQQPRVTNEIHATMMDLNSYAEEITAMQRQRKPLRIFYSKTSAHQYSGYMDHIFELYEKLNFDGVSLGFVTENIINKQDSKSWDVVLLCGTPRVTKAEIDALQAYLNNGGTIIMDSKSLVEDEYGGAISALRSGSGKIIKVSEIEEFYKESLTVLENKGLLPEVSISEINELDMKGCTWRCVKNKEGNNVVSVINLGKSEALITVELSGAKTGTACWDLINGIQVSSKQKLQPYEVLFVEVTDGEDVDSGVFQRKVGDDDMGKLFPNPSSGNFNIKLNKPYHKLRLSVLDMHGKVVSDQDFCDVNFIEYQIQNVSEGSYVVRLNSDIEVQNFILIKN